LGERFRIVEASALASTFGDEPCFEAGDTANRVGFDFVDPHVGDDNAVKEKVDKFPRAVAYVGGVLMLHSGLQLGGLGAIHSSPVRFRFHTLSGGKESDGTNMCCADWGVGWASDHVGHVGLLGMK
jgi:hypothetical protein